MILKVVISIAAVLLVACSNSVSDGSQSDERDSLSSDVAAESSADAEQSSSSSATCEEIRSTKNDFVPIENVLPCVQENEKVAFIIRHGERNAGESGYDDTLNANGAEQARELGRRLKDYSDFYFMHTDYLRTLETGYRIAEGKGQKVEEFTRENCDSIVHEWNDDLRYDWYLKDGSYMSMCASGNNMAAYTKMAYEVDDYYCDLAFYNAKERTMEFVRNHFTYGKMHDITFAVTHDLFVAPLMISITDGEIGMDYYKYGDEYYWPNFLAGAAVIVDDQDNVTMVPVRGLSSGRMAER
ncbi:histidine phosphatase family protein [Fibrobacter sp. UWEL]|uniref:histidine phosphatase family protein n=1 Tax=Fibrobacter sp. UWEL TaxID=1896209 RepID=UPI00091611DF|nr:histidine phosphatase family protein [Fibrobacter sp. UWEL]SHL08431.1 Histidine phosphatase superfamily (branch 1) [Fibrobacter sp. UWEL]